MKYYSTSNPNNFVNSSEAILNSFPKDGGLYLPQSIPVLSESFWDRLESLTLSEIAFEITSLYFDEIPEQTLQSICESAFNFPAPLVELEKNLFVLELFHGPSLAFKDFGARFMSRIMGYFMSERNELLNILVATSGDTGGAVAAGFEGVRNTRVIILYPKGGVSKIQEAQLTQKRENIITLEVEGTFDDCQSLVKEAFINEEINNHLVLSSANSINICRLIPQTIYYFWAYNQMTSSDKKPIFIVPSGNLGNISAGIIAGKMGLPFQKFIASHNINNTFFRYIKDGSFLPKESQKTFSNAMDVGKPSNFSRIDSIYSSTWNNIIADIDSYFFNDDQTLSAIKEAYRSFRYILDPHTAIGYLASKPFSSKSPKIILSTAHPIKFGHVMENALGFTPETPESLKDLLLGDFNKTSISKDFNSFSNFLLGL
jgi:threonine synthase